MNARMKIFLKGLALGLAGKPLEFAPGKEPVAYLYNGVRLPPLPVEWNSDERPYAIIYTDTQSNKERLFVSKVPLTLFDNYNDGNYTFSANSFGGISPKTFDNDGTRWVDGLFYPVHISASTYIWSNYDIKDPKGLAGAAGSVYREGSDPIPVYE